MAEIFQAFSVRLLMRIVSICAMAVLKFKESQIFIFVDLIIVAALTFGVIVPFDTPLSLLLSTYAVEVMGFFLAMGFVGFFLRNNSIVLVNFLACISLCSFIKESDRLDFANAIAFNDTEVHVAHLVLDNQESIAELERKFEDLEADFLSIQTPIKPTLEKQLIKQLSKRLPYWEKTICNNDLSLFVFSAYELRDLDTLYNRYDNTISLVGKMFVEDINTELAFLSTNVSVGENLNAENKNQLARLSSYIKNNCQNKPLLTLSGAQLASWSPEIQAFRTAHRMSDSRNDVRFSSRNEHIFYSKDLMCTAFSEILKGNGVLATYKFKPSDITTAQKLPVTSASSRLSL